MTKLFSLIFFTFLALASCRKNYTCTCIITQTEDGDSYSYPEVNQINDASKVQAKVNCPEGPQTVLSGDGFSLSRDCILSN